MGKPDEKCPTCGLYHLGALERPCDVPRLQELFAWWGVTLEPADERWLVWLARSGSDAVATFDGLVGRMRDAVLGTWWAEYDRAAEWCAKRLLDRGPGWQPKWDGELPGGLSPAARTEIEGDPEAFARRVREVAYGLAMEGVPGADEGVGDAD